jgi:hypothetical protein
VLGMQEIADAKRYITVRMLVDGRISHVLM